MPPLPGDSDVPAWLQGDGSVNSRRTPRVAVLREDFIVHGPSDPLLPTTVARTTPSRRRPSRHPSSAGSVVGQTTRRPVKDTRPRSQPRPRTRTRKPAPRTLPQYINPAPRRPHGIRLRGEGLDVRPRAYDWFGGAPGGKQYISPTYAQLAGLTASSHPRAGVMRYGRGYTKKPARKRTRKTAKGPAGPVEARLRKLQGELSALAETMRRRL
ncbi:hypothetical protein WJX74_010461 [Apatococcus lobatus]|uniref:Uncharacterized protein n=1 Tax=Apatococcus lobatus TaxID=904363 RepID=A0AAW1R081_9CHLO